MAEKKAESFKVTDRRLFTTDGDLRQETTEEHSHAPEPPEPVAITPKPEPVPPAPAPIESMGPELIDSAMAEDPQVPLPPTAAEQQTQVDAYKKSSKELDARVELSGHSAKELEMTFERFLASLYMSAMVQLGLMHEQGGQPRVDLIGARQTIDTLSLISEKTKGNLTSAEENFMQNSLYELRMAYVEVTNALSRPPQATGTDFAKR